MRRQDRRAARRPSGARRGRGSGDEALALGGAFDLEIKNLPGGPTFDPHGRLALLVAARARPGDLLTSFYWPDMDKVQDAGTARTGLLIPESGSVQDAISYAVANGHQVIAPHHTLIDKGSMGAAEASDLTVIAWTVNEHAKARELSNLGVSAIITDRPHVLAELGKVETS